MSNLANLDEMIAPVVEARGFRLVRVTWIDGTPATLQVMVEDPATGQMLVDDCARVSRALSAMLDEVDPIDSEYLLEVSSPGIDRPLTRIGDFERWAGHVAKLELAEGVPMGGAVRKRFQGVLAGIADEEVLIAVDGLGQIALPFASIGSAKLVLTDRLIAETVPLSTEGADDIEEEADEALPTDMTN